MNGGGGSSMMKMGKSAIKLNFRKMKVGSKGLSLGLKINGFDFFILVTDLRFIIIFYE